jgi:hypothetical protein
MVKFLWKGFLFCLPIIIVFGIPFWIMYRSGELISDDQLVEREASTQPVIVGDILSDPTDYVQLNAAIAKNPTVLVLGSSRSRQFRSTFFNPSTTVYTAGGIIQDIRSFREYLNHIPPEKDPKVLIIGLDQRLFSEAYDAIHPADIEDLLTNPISTQSVLANWSLVYQYYFEKKFTLAQVINATDTVGLLANANGEGYRNDGSYDPGTEEYFAPSVTSDYITGIDNGSDGFEHDPTVSSSSITELNAFLAECKMRGIAVIGFAPPFSPEIYAKMLSMPSDYGYLTGLSQAVEPLFKKYSYSFYNFTNPATLGLTARDMQDGAHPTERGTLIMFLKMVEANTTLQQYANPAYIKKILSTTQAETNVFAK